MASLDCQTRHHEGRNLIAKCSSEPDPLAQLRNDHQHLSQALRALRNALPSLASECDCDIQGKPAPATARSANV